MIYYYYIIIIDLKQLLMKVKEASAKEGLHLNLKKTKIMTTKEIYSFALLIDNAFIVY